jgi:hypothetical protein
MDQAIGIVGQAILVATAMLLFLVVLFFSLIVVRAIRRLCHELTLANHESNDPGIRHSSSHQALHPASVALGRKDLRPNAREGLGTARRTHPRPDRRDYGCQGLTDRAPPPVDGIAYPADLVGIEVTSIPFKNDSLIELFEKFFVLHSATLYCLLKK